MAGTGALLAGNRRSGGAGDDNQAALPNIRENPKEPAGRRWLCLPSKDMEPGQSLVLVGGDFSVP